MLPKIKKKDGKNTIIRRLWQHHASGRYSTTDRTKNVEGRPPLPPNFLVRFRSPSISLIQKLLI